MPLRFFIAHRLATNRKDSDHKGYSVIPGYQAPGFKRPAKWQRSAISQSAAWNLEPFHSNPR